MKFDFTDGDDNSKSRSGVVYGSYEDLLKERKKLLPEIEHDITEAFEDYSGQAFCLIIMNEDENGRVKGNTQIMGGVCHLEDHMKMAESLQKAAERSIELMMEGVRGNPEAMRFVAEKLIDKIKEQLED